MRTDPLVEWLSGCPVTSVTSGNTAPVTPESAPALNVTRVTPVTSQNAAAIRMHLLRLAAKMGIPASVVEALHVEELDTTAAQVARCEGYMDGNGDPLAHSLLVFYLRQLADKIIESDRRGCSSAKEP